jgi:hypothetical protein
LGRHDPETPVVMNQKHQRGPKNSAQAFFEESGHVPLSEAKARYTEVIQRYWK